MLSGELLPVEERCGGVATGSVRTHMGAVVGARRRSARCRRWGRRGTGGGGAGDGAADPEADTDGGSRYAESQKALGEAVSHVHISFGLGAPVTGDHELAR